MPSRATVQPTAAGDQTVVTKKNALKTDLVARLQKPLQIDHESVIARLESLDSSRALTVVSVAASDSTFRCHGLTDNNRNIHRSFLLACPVPVPFPSKFS